MANIERSVGTSGADAAQTVSSPTEPTAVRRVNMITVAYSAAPTQGGVTVTINNGAGAGYDCPLLTGAANARYTTFLPTAELYLNVDDVLDVLAPAGGVGITSAIAIYTEFGY